MNKESKTVLSRIAHYSMKRIFIVFAVCCLATPLFAATLKPENTGQFFVTPDTKSVIRFQLTGDEKPGALEFRLYGSGITETESKIVPAVVDGNTVSVTVNLPRGFWELEYEQQRFGVVSLPAFKGSPDKFFAIDAALSWRNDDDPFRAGLIKTAKRNGIGMVRERLSWRGIEPEAGQFQWETPRRYDALRKLYKEHGVEVLEVFHDAPRWMERLEATYPADLVKTAKSWDTIAKRWHTSWGALEIWNEPEIFFGGDLPADQYVAMARAIARQLKQSKIPTPLICGVLSHFHPAWLENAAENGLLRDVDGFSFHSYDHAPELEEQVGKFRGWLEESGDESMPLWLTECGRPWKGGTDRPAADQDLASAVDITMKGVEARCCGVERYFPFIYMYYDEGENNFGMMDKPGTPCRSFAAYTQLIHVLSGAKYAGDLKIADSSALRARVFEPLAPRAGAKELVAVLYTASFPQPKTLKIPAGKIKRVESVLGEPLKLPDNGGLLIQPNSLYYVWFDRASLAGQLNTETEAMKLYQAAQKPRKRGEDIPPAVIRFQYDKTKVSAHWTTYFIPPGTEYPLPLKFRVFNLDQDEKKYDLRFEIDQTVDSLSGVVVAGQGFTDVHWNLSLEENKNPYGELRILRVTLNGNGDNRPLVVNFYRGASWDATVSTAKNIRELSINDLSSWQKNVSENGVLEIESNDSICRMTATFNAKENRWFYPQFQLPDDVDLSNASEIVVEGRCTDKTDTRFRLFEKSGSGYASSGLVFKSDGLWHVARLPFTYFQHEATTPPDENNQLDLDRVNVISIGASSNAPECVLEIKKITILLRDN